MNNLEHLQVGDAVCICRTNRWSGDFTVDVVGHVEKVTKTQITALNGRRFMRRDGMEVGAGGWQFAPRLVVYDQRIKDRAEESKKISSAISSCQSVASFLSKAKGNDAISLAGMLPSELIAMAKGGAA